MKPIESVLLEFVCTMFTTGTPVFFFAVLYTLVITKFNFGIKGVMVSYFACAVCSLSSVGLLNCYVLQPLFHAEMVMCPRPEFSGLVNRFINYAHCILHKC